MKALRPGIEHAQKEVIWLHLRGEGDREWRKVRFTGVKTLLRFLEAEEWGFVGLLIVFEKKVLSPSRRKRYDIIRYAL
ncbi:MAG TPA: hypothetical protein VN957_01395 [Chthoniobacterales bacterium]|nr:hypothetical protein [Chthoniobacterales bacterium]